MPTKCHGRVIFLGADLLLGLLHLPALRPLPLVGEVGQLPGLRRSCQVRKFVRTEIWPLYTTFIIVYHRLSTFDAFLANEIVYVQARGLLQGAVGEPVGGQGDEGAMARPVGQGFNLMEAL